MTKEEALQAMILGEKVAHRFFTSDEFIYMESQYIYMEDDICVGTISGEFWISRSGGFWEKDWAIYEN